ncbi:HAMP domain-containing sensor histidine kinase [uncultured Clostridium sp.]|uniref:sensor histidine kinase n=1 Tax=uncultured Clostridium sp. TaxID=59620 RepID=UPI0026338374|nr:HAMP domain-containing sensor histidine kinase [uncultured Clostridium sp.]
MRIFKIKSLYMRIWITFTIAIIGIVFVLTILYSVIFRRLQLENNVRYLINTQDNIIKEINGDTFDNEYALIYKGIGLESFIVETENNQRKIINLDGNYDSDDIKYFNSNIRDISNEAELWMASYAKDPTYKNKVFIERRKFGDAEKSYVFVISNVVNSQNKEEYIVTYTEGNETKALIFILISIGILFIIISFFVAKFLAGYITKYLKSVESYAKKVSRKEWVEPLEVTTDDELGSLVHSMNNMRIELEKVDKEEKIFFQSISHDLKTPVMIIQSHAEALIDGMYIGSVEETAEIIKKESQILEKKIKQILYLNTLDYMLANDKEIKELDLEYLLDEIYYKFRFINKKIDWKLNLEKETYIYGNEEKLVTAIENIIENSLRYVESEIEIKLYKNDKKIIIEIFNDGEKIKEEDLENIFDNLYKGKSGNFGLGLYITRKIIDYYKGTIYVKNEENGVRFFIEFENHTKIT